jgi:hypothetical protein
MSAAGNYFPKNVSPPSLPSDADPKAWTNLYEDLSTAVDSIAASYLAPALQLNNYLESSATDVEAEELRHVNPDIELPSNVLRRVSTNAYAASVLLAVKSALDRLVRILAFYYPGIAGHTTWGRYDKKGNPSGFMAVVARGRESDALLAAAHEAYERWIRKAVAARDSLIHYRDAESHWYFLPEDRALVQTHAVEDTDGQSHGYGITSLCEFVGEWYQLADETLLRLAAKLPKPPRISTSARPL